MEMYNLCFIKPNKNAFSETFVQQHIDRLAGNKFVLYGGAFPVYDDKDDFLIKSKLEILSYLIQKRIFKKKYISIRTKALINYLKAHKIDAVFAEYGMVGALVTEACRIARVPLVIHYHGADVHHNETVKSYLNLYKKAFEYASYLIVVSYDMVEELKKLGAPADKILWSPCGVDTVLFPLVDISASGPDFLSVGRFVEKKSPLSVIRAFKFVIDKFPQAKLTMVGDGPLFEDAKNLVSELELGESVTLTGVLKSAEIRELMKRSRCFVQHSVTAESGDKEGTPVTILEASSSGLPVVSTAHAGIKEAVIDGETGYLVAENDIEGMAEKMMIFAADTDMAVKFGQSGRKYMLENYDIKYSIYKIDNAIKKSIAAKQPYNT